jgi:hypothetical protein
MLWQMLNARAARAARISGSLARLERALVVTSALQSPGPGRPGVRIYRLAHRSAGTTG